VNMKRFALGTLTSTLAVPSLGLSLPGFDGFIGHDFFAKHVVCIDFPEIEL